MKAEGTDWAHPKLIVCKKVKNRTQGRSNELPELSHGKGLQARVWKEKKRKEMIMNKLG